MKRLLFAPNKPPRKIPAQEKGDLCLALPMPDMQLPSNPDKFYLATIAEKGKNKVIFFDDGSETVHDVMQTIPTSAEDREMARQRYSTALTEAKRLAVADSEEVRAGPPHTLAYRRAIGSLFTPAYASRRLRAPAGQQGNRSSESDDGRHIGRR